jgi:hypothetical protein
MASFGRVKLAERMGQKMSDLPRLQRWFESSGRERRSSARLPSAVDVKDPKVRAVLFGQWAR